MAGMVNAIPVGYEGGTPVSIMVYVQDVDRFVDHAVSAGAKVLRPVENKFYGDRAGSLEDPSDTSGTSRRMWRMCLPMNWRHVPRRS